MVLNLIGVSAESRLNTFLPCQASNLMTLADYPALIFMTNGLVNSGAIFLISWFLIDNTLSIRLKSALPTY